jgi:hypothetical protein
MKAEPLHPDGRALLAELNAHIDQISQAARADRQNAAHNPTGPDTWPELRSAQRFRETWERLAAEVQVQNAQARAPQNAGPLNPQRLMLSTLARMGELSPHYLRRFLAHAESLLWLEQAQPQLKPLTKKAKPAKLTREKKG